MGVGVCSAVVALSVFPGSAKQYKMHPQPIDPKGIEINIKLKPGAKEEFNELEYMKDGKWDLKKLRKRQEEYFDFIRNGKRVGKDYSLPNAVSTFMPIINRVGKEYGVDPKVIASIIQAESFGYTYAVGEYGELGLMQPNPKAHPKEFEANYRDIFNPFVNITLGTEILKDYLVEFHWNYELAVEAYNAGGHSIARGRLPYDTKEYVKEVLLRCELPKIYIRR